MPALWISPLSDPMLMLKLAFAWGVGFILLAMGYFEHRKKAGRAEKAEQTA